MIELIKRNIFSSLLIFNVFLFFIILVIFDIRLAENDDVIMALIASGGYGGNIDSHLVFINVVYGKVLNFLYYLMPQVEWYTIMFILINILCTSLVGNKMFQLLKNNFAKVAFFVFLFVVFFEITVYIQFTKTSAISAIAGVLYLYDEKDRNKYLGCLLFVLAALIRFEAAFLVLIIVGVIFLYDHLKENKLLFDSKTKWLIISIVIAFTFKFIDTTYYSIDKDWGYYKEYNSLRGKINDNPNVRFDLNPLPSGISRLDYSALLCFFPNPKVIDLDALEKIYSVIDEIPEMTKIRYAYRLWRYKEVLILASIIFFAFYYKNEIPYPQNHIIKILFIAFIGILVYLSFNASVKYRVLFSSLISFVFVLPFFYTKIRRLVFRNIVLISIILLAICLVKIRFDIFSYERYYSYVYKNQSSFMKEYLDESKRQLIIYAGDYKIEYQNPFQVSKNFYSNRLFYGGWLSSIPFHKNKFESFESFVDQNALFVMRYNYKRAISQVVNGIQVESNIKVVPNIVSESKEYLIVEFAKKN